MLVPIEVLEYDLKASGFNFKIPKNEHTFIGGRDAGIEDAPLGYYRFHYWINSDTSKPHENYVFIGKNAGFICISMMQESDNRYRLLIRSAMGWKSLIIDSDNLKNDKSHSNLNTIILKEALNKFCESLFPDNEFTSTFQSGLSSPLNMISIDINNNEDELKDERNVSRNSSLNSVRSSLTLSALRSSFAGSQDTISFSRFGSMASLSDVPTDLIENLEFDEERRSNIIEDLRVKFFKKAYKIKDNSFASNLLELEKPLTPKTFNFDVIDLSEIQCENFIKFQNSLGQEINKKETINYVKILTEKFKMADAISSSVSKKIENSLENSKSGKSPNSAKLDAIMAEFIETERNYLQHLKLIDKLFISYLRDDDSGKFILKVKDYKDVFGGISDFIPIHEKFLTNLLISEGIDNFIAALKELSDSKSLYSYQSYFTIYEKRMDAFKSCLENYPKFALYHDNCVNNIVELNKKGLDQLLIAPIQRMPRYSLLLKEALKYVTDDLKYETLKSVLDEISKVTHFLNTTKHKAEQTEKLFMIQRKVYDFPPDFLKAERIFLAKIACFMVDSLDGKITKTRLTIYLYNDMVMFAKKRSSASGYHTHDFILSVSVKHIQIHASRSKNAEKMFFTAEIDLEHSNFTNNISILDSTLFSHKKRSIIPSLNEDGIVSTSFQFSPKNQKRLSGFISEFIEARNQFILSESPAKLLFKQEEKWDIFFHVYDTKKQIQSENKSQVLIAYVEDEVDLKDNYDLLSEYSAVAIVQGGGRSSTFRFIIGTNRPHISGIDASFYEAGQDLADIRSFMKEFYKAILNTHHFISIYPPYSKTVIQQRRFVLESAVSVSKSGAISSLNKNSGIKSFFSGLAGNSDKSNGDKLSRGSSLKNGSSPLSTPHKLSNNARSEELKKEIQLESSMSLLHL